MQIKQRIAVVLPNLPLIKWTNIQFKFTKVPEGISLFYITGQIVTFVLFFSIKVCLVYMYKGNMLEKRKTSTKQFCTCQC